MNRPTLIPGLPRRWRGRTDLQLGTDPARAVLLHLTDATAVRLLDLLDGTRPERLILRQAADHGIPEPQARALLETLTAAGLVVAGGTVAPSDLPARHRGEAAAIAHDLRPPWPRTPGATELSPAQVMRRRAASRVAICGRSRLGAGVAVALGQAGIGHLQLETPGEVQLADLPGGPLRDADLGSPRQDAIAAAVTRAAPEVKFGAARRQPAAMLVQFDHDQPVALLAAAHAARRQPHLAVTLREGVAVVGPHVLPSGAPCLHCLDLHRRDRDPHWPGIPIPARDPIPEPAAVATVLATVAYITAEVLTAVDGGVPETLGAAVEIASPTRIRRRTWPPHPACPCARTGRPARSPDAPAAARRSAPLPGRPAARPPGPRRAG